MKKNIIYVDSFSVGAFHEMFNASSLKMFAEMFNEVTYFTSNSVKNNIYRILNDVPGNIQHKHIPIIGGDNKIGSLLRLFIPILTNSYILLKSNRNDLIFFNYNALWSFPLVNFLSKILNRKVIIMCHGEMEYLTTDIHLNYFSRYGLNRFKSQKFEPSKGIYFCVLGKSIKQNLQRCVSEKVRNKIISFDHSYIFRDKVSCENKNNTITRIGTVGTIRWEKGLELLIQMGENLKTNNNISIHALGRVRCDPKLLKDAGVNIIEESDQRFLTREELDNAISQLDYIIFLYPQDGYKYTASGALFDAIDNEKPILALRNDYFNYVFKSLANVGLLFKNENELIDYLNGFKNKSKSIDYKRIKNKLGPKAVGEVFLNELKKIGFIQ